MVSISSSLPCVRAVQHWEPVVRNAGLDLRSHIHLHFTLLSSQLTLLQTTSPSYLLLASLDAAQAQARLLREGRSPALLTSVSACKRMLRSLHGITLLEDRPEGQQISCSPWQGSRRIS